MKSLGFLLLYGLFLRVFAEHECSDGQALCRQKNGDMACIVASALREITDEHVCVFNNYSSFSCSADSIPCQIQGDPANFTCVHSSHLYDVISVPEQQQQQPAFYCLTIGCGPLSLQPIRPSLSSRFLSKLTIEKDCRPKEIIESVCNTDYEHHCRQKDGIIACIPFTAVREVKENDVCVLNDYSAFSCSAGSIPCYLGDDPANHTCVHSSHLYNVFSLSEYEYEPPSFHCLTKACEPKSYVSVRHTLSSDVLRKLSVEKNCPKRKIADPRLSPRGLGGQTCPNGRGFPCRQKDGNTACIDPHAVREVKENRVCVLKDYSEFSCPVDSIPCQLGENGANFTCVHSSHLYEVLSPSEERSTPFLCLAIGCTPNSYLGFEQTVSTEVMGKLRLEKDCPKKAIVEPRWIFKRRHSSTVVQQISL